MSETQFDVDALCVFKLMNGEVIVCEIVSEDEQQVTVRCAVRAIEIFTLEDGEVRYAQWIPFTEDLIILYRHGILAAAAPSDSMKEMYLNKMAEQETIEDPTSNEDTPVFRRLCRNHAFSTKK